MSGDELAVLADNPRLIPVAGVLFLIGYGLKIAAQASETVAKMLGGLGRRWQEQKRKAEQNAIDARESRNAVIEDLRGQVEHFVERVDRLDRRVTRLQDDADLRDDYLAYDAEWHAQLERHAALAGWEPVPPPHKTFGEFRREMQALRAGG